MKRLINLLPLFTLLVALFCTVPAAMACAGDGDECLCPQGGDVVWLPSWSCNSYYDDAGNLLYSECSQDWTCYQDDLESVSVRPPTSRDGISPFQPLDIGEPPDVDLRRILNA